MTDPAKYLEAVTLAAKIIAPLAKDLVPYLLGTGPLPEWFRVIPNPTRSRLALEAREARLTLKSGG